MQIISEFKKFAMRGNVVDMAVGIIIGAAFSTIVNSLVNDIVMPVVGWLTGGVDFSDAFVPLGKGEFSTLAEAKASGIATISYGLFINAVLSFLIVAWVLFIVIRAMNSLKSKESAPEPTEKACDFCTLNIPLGAKRCPHCTSVLES